MIENLAGLTMNYLLVNNLVVNSPTKPLAAFDEVLPRYAKEFNGVDYKDIEDYADISDEAIELVHIEGIKVATSGKPYHAESGFILDMINKEFL